MAPNFAHLLRKPAGEAKKPEPLKAGDYPAVISKFEFGESNKKKTPFVRFFIGLQGWPEDFEPEDQLSYGKPVDLSKKQQRIELYLMPDGSQDWRLDEFFRGIGLEPAGKTYEELIPEAIGVQGLATVTQEMSQEEDGGAFNRVAKFVAAD